MSNLDYSLPTNGLHHLIPRMWSGSGRFAIFSWESLPVVVAVAVLVVVVVVVVVVGVVVAVVAALELLEPRGEKLVKSAHRGRRRNKRQRGG